MGYQDVDGYANFDQVRALQSTKSFKRVPLVSVLVFILVIRYFLFFNYFDVNISVYGHPDLCETLRRLCQSDGVIKRPFRIKNDGIGAPLSN